MSVEVTMSISNRKMVIMHAQTFNLIIIIYSRVAIYPKDSRSIFSIAENIRAVTLSIEIFLFYATALIISSTIQMAKSCRNAQ